MMNRFKRHNKLKSLKVAQVKDEMDVDEDDGETMSMMDNGKDGQ